VLRASMYRSLVFLHCTIPKAQRRYKGKVEHTSNGNINRCHNQYQVSVGSSTHCDPTALSDSEHTLSAFCDIEFTHHKCDY
jgi:hypothetical protein